MDCNDNKCNFNAPNNVMMQVNLCNCNINNMCMMNNGLDEDPPTTMLYKITAAPPDRSEIFNIKIDRTQKEPQLVLTKEQTDTVWQVIGGSVNQNSLISIGTPSGDEFWTVIDEESWISFRPQRNMGNPTQFFDLTTIGNNAGFLERIDSGVGPIRFIGSSTIPLKEGSLISSVGVITIFIFTPITML